MYGQRKQLTKPEDVTPLLSSERVTNIQQILGTLLYYERMVDPKLLVAINTLWKQQKCTTETTCKHLQQLLDYCSTFPNSKIRYNKRQMILKIHSDASYLSAPHSQSLIGGFFYLGNQPVLSHNNNGSITTTETVLNMS